MGFLGRESSTSLESGIMDGIRYEVLPELEHTQHGRWSLTVLTSEQNIAG